MEIYLLRQSLYDGTERLMATLERSAAEQWRSFDPRMRKIEVLNDREVVPQIEAEQEALVRQVKR